MAIALAQAIVHKARTTTTTTTTVTINGVTAGSLLVLVLAWFNADASAGMGVTDDKGNTWQAVPTTPASGDASSHCGIFYAMNCAAGNTVITLDPSGSASCTLEGDVLELGPAERVNALDVQPADASGTSTTPAITTGTLVQGDEAVIMINSHTGLDLTSMAHDSADGFTEISENLNNTSGQSYESQYKIVTVTTSLTINCTYNASRTWFATAASFKGGTTLALTGVSATGNRGTVMPQATAIVTGTAADGMTEAEVVAGGQTIVISMTSDTFIPA